MKKQKDAEDAVLEYLIKQNRPYSAGDIFNNMHKEHGKTAVVKALESLAETKKIKEKVYGKQKVYAPCQEQYGDYDEKEIKDLDKTIQEQQSAKDALQAKLKAQESELQTLNCQMTTAEISNKLQQLTKECIEMTSRVASMKSGSNIITAKEKDLIYKEHAKFVQHWKKRKRMATNILDSILENYPKPKKALFEDIGIETDEEAGVSYEKTS